MAKTDPIIAPRHLVVANLANSVSSYHLQLPARVLLGGNNRRQWVITTDADTHHHTPEDQKTNDRHRWRGSGQGLSQGAEDDEDQLQSVHLLPANEIGKDTEANLSQDGTTRCCDLDGSIRVFRDGSRLRFGRMPVYNTQHSGDEVDGEDVIGVCEEAYAGDDNGSHMVPTERGLVDFSEGKATSWKVALAFVLPLIVGALQGVGYLRSLGSSMWT